MSPGCRDFVCLAQVFNEHSNYGGSLMKTRKIFCMAITAVMLAAVCAFTANAAALTVSQNFGAMSNNVDLKPADIGAYSVHGVVIDSKDNGAKMLCGTPQSSIGIGDDVTKGLDLGAPNAELLAKADISYAAYKLSADSGKCLDSVSVSINGMMNPYKGASDKNNQVAVYVTKSIDADEKGKINFSTLTAAAVFQNDNNINDFRSDEKTKTADISAAVAALGEQQDIYVIIAILDPWEPASSSWESGYDHSRCRISKLAISATQKNVSAPDVPPAPETSDAFAVCAVILAIASVTAISVRKRKAQ